MTDRVRIYIDSTCFIDMVKTHLGKLLETDREKDVWFLKRLFEASRDHELDLFASVLSIAECSHAGDGDISEPAKARFDRLLMSGQYVRLVQPTPFIGQAARDLRWVHKIEIRGADALHLASAIDVECSEFLTTNGKILKLQEFGKLPPLGIDVRKPRETQNLPDKYRQLGLEVENGP